MNFFSGISSSTEIRDITKVTMVTIGTTMDTRETIITGVDIGIGATTEIIDMVAMETEETIVVATIRTCYLRILNCFN